MAVDRTRARALAQEFVGRGDAVGWFESLYREAAEGTAVVPWADLVPNPHLVAWLDRQTGRPGRALDVGCGLGDNAEELARRGWRVTAFDVSETAVVEACRRFSESSVDYVVADALEPPAAWSGAFDLVAETYTLQVLPPSARRRAVDALRRLVAPGGVLLVIARGRHESDPEGSMPWPLTRAEVEAIATPRLRVDRFEDFLDEEEPPVRRFRVEFRNA